MYQVLARKWRPQSLEELIGQSHVARTLRNALTGNRLAHAYLFAGLRGTGKTTVARILAKCLNCQEGPTPNPCNRCSSCVEIGDGRSLDVLEIDAASRTGVGDIRELQEIVAYSPVRDRYRVLVIDEVHMLSKNAFNALLKTLEEPPAQVVFILATTEIQKILPTILSRCQVFEFRRVPAREVAEHLRRMCDAEGIKISPETLQRIAHAGEGSVRDSLSILERVVAFCGTDVRDEETLPVLGAVRAETLARMIGALAARDAATMLATLDAVVDEGHDLLHFWGELVGAIRDVQLQRTLPDRADLVARPAEEAATLLAAAEGLSMEDLGRSFHQLAGLEIGLKASAQPRFLFEAALLRLASLGAVLPIEQILAQTSGQGVDSVIEAVGADETIALALGLVRVAGVVSVIGVSTNPAFPFNLLMALMKDLTFRIGICPVPELWDDLVPLVQSGRLRPESVFTHRMPLSHGPEAYALFDSRRDGVMKILLDPTR
jgi:DNA polymerase-3 subunit gamma/tau